MSEEIYAINIKGEQRGNMVIQDVYYMIGIAIPSHTGKPTIVQKITMSIKGDRLFIYFADETRMVIGYSPQKVDLFYRPVKQKEETKTKENEQT
jgi:hypothetical protein